MDLCWRGSLRQALVFVLIGLFCNFRTSQSIRFVIEREECFSHDVKYEGDAIHVSFVVVKADSPWHYGNEGVDLVVCLFPACSLTTFDYSVSWFNVLI